MKPIALLLAAAVPLAAADAPYTASEVIARMDAVLAEAVEVVQSNFDAVAAEGGLCPLVDACGSELSPVSDADFDTTLGVDKSTSSVFLRPARSATDDDVQKDVCVTSNLEPIWEDNIAEEDAIIKWQYAATQSAGIFRAYPGNEGHCGTDFDPRFRPWYSAAVTGPRDVIIVIDTSGSMSEGTRMSQAIAAGKAVIDTLNHGDYANIVEFASDASRFSDMLVRVTEENRDSFKTYLDSLTPFGGTNYEAALNAAFDAVEVSRGAGQSTFCSSTLLFLTDGVVSEGGDAIEALNARNTGDTFMRVFTYKFGFDGDDTTLRDMACESDGVFFDVDDSSNTLEETMASYFTYLAAGIDETEVRWSEEYTDGLGLGQVITGCLPAFDNSGSVQVIHSVVCADVRLVDIENSADFVDQVTTDTRSSCPNLALSFDQLEVLRGAEAQCGPSNSSGSSSSSGSGVVIGVSVPLVILVAVIIIVCIRRNRKSKKSGGPVRKIAPASRSARPAAAARPAGAAAAAKPAAATTNANTTSTNNNTTSADNNNNNNSINITVNQPAPSPAPAYGAPAPAYGAPAPAYGAPAYGGYPPQPGYGAPPQAYPPAPQQPVYSQPAYQPPPPAY